MLFKFMESMPVAVDEESTSTSQLRRAIRRHACTSHQMGPLERTVLTFERRHGPLPLRPDVYRRVFTVESKYQNQKEYIMEAMKIYVLMEELMGSGRGVEEFGGLWESV
ncbi:hypothetical protein PM082_004540 [Marasmius tenuissimus]|nr:hypothetical protein PM082_004540 [Marasmius tenuissimus]